MRLNVCGARKALVVAVMGCMGTILAAGQHKEQSTTQTVAAKKDGRAEIDAHAANNQVTGEQPGDEQPGEQPGDNNQVTDRTYTIEIAFVIAYYDCA